MSNCGKGKKGNNYDTLAGLHQLQELSLAHNRLRVGGIGPGTWHELQALHPWPVIKPRPLHCEHRGLATGPPGKSPTFFY